MFVKPIICIFVTLAVLSGCSSSITSSELPLDYSSVVRDEYKLGVGDKISVSVWKNPELSAKATIRPDGIITVPLAGEFSAAGLSPVALRAKITKKLSVYIKKPQVTVTVSSTSSAEFIQRVRVTGAVETPLSVPWREGMTVLDVVLMAGGATEFASENNAKLYRKAEGSVKSYPIKLEDILRRGRLETNYALAPSDIITIPERLF